jgi:hypothetical protein
MQQQQKQEQKEKKRPNIAPDLSFQFSNIKQKIKIKLRGRKTTIFIAECCKYMEYQQATYFMLIFAWLILRS